ncbi:MAG: hypothetical protein V4693_13330 [Pseudomonadota bacterium]
MKSVSMSQVVRAHDPIRFLCPIQSWRQLLSLGFTLVVGLTFIAMVCMAIDPSAPVAYILVPVLVGGLAPVFAALPARFQVNTRFHAQYFVKTLDEAILSMGYSATQAADGRTSYQPQARLFRWKENAIEVSVRDHAIVVGGPVFALRMLQQRLAN